MAVWAIGDIQGCNDSLQQLLIQINFDPNKDKLWIAGDLVNRGNQSLEVLEYLYSIRESVVTVLGNHDITLIAAYYGIKKSNETLDPILQSPNAKKLIGWLRDQKFLHVDYTLGYCMAHAGISPEFDLGMALEYAKRVEERLQRDDVEIWLTQMFKHGIERFNRDASAIDIDRYIVRPTELLKQKGLKPWFDCENRKDVHMKIIFGHWSTLGYYQDENVLALDTGCLWGGELTAARIDSEALEIVSVSCNNSTT
jgi:bis(5'-nucleosyl)-tetraphosphatase (symmetrical)